MSFGPLWIWGNGRPYPCLGVILETRRPSQFRCHGRRRSGCRGFGSRRERERISLSLTTQQDPWQEFADGHKVGELVYGRVTKLVPFGSFVQVGDGIEGLVHISEMSAHHVELPEQVVTPGEELWVKNDLDLQRRRIGLSIKQAAEGGVVAAEYQEAFGEHAYDESGNFIGEFSYDAQPKVKNQRLRELGVNITKSTAKGLSSSRRRL